MQRRLEEVNMSISRITINIFRSLTKDLIKNLNDIGIVHLTDTTGRSSVIQESKGILALLGGSSGLADNPSDIITFAVPNDREDDVVNFIIEKAQLNLPGRGSVYAEKIDVDNGHAMCEVNQPQAISPQKFQTLREATGICCIVQRGQGNKIAQVVLESGAGVPTISYGTGLGVRDKMGLLRITIPADKELVWVALSKFDADIVMNAMIEMGELDQPGKGFIYTYPLSQALLNMQVTNDTGRSAASMEQVISAIDEIKGNIEWRKRATAVDDHNRTYLQGLIDFTLVCDEGGGDELVAAAMAAGAAGASISKMKQISPNAGSGSEHISRSRESCYMIIAESAKPQILKALEEAGAFGDKYHGIAQSHSTHKAFTYLPPKKD